MTLDTHHSNVGNYERYEAVPSIEVIQKIADALEVSLAYLAGEGVNSKLLSNKKIDCIIISPPIPKPEPKLNINFLRIFEKIIKLQWTHNIFN